MSSTTSCPRAPFSFLFRIRFDGKFNIIYTHFFFFFNDCAQITIRVYYECLRNGTFSLSTKKKFSIKNLTILNSSSRSLCIYRFCCRMCFCTGYKYVFGLSSIFFHYEKIVLGFNTYRTRVCVRVVVCKGERCLLILIFILPSGRLKNDGSYCATSYKAITVFSYPIIY